MTVSTTTSRVEYAGNGSTVAFSVPFYFLASADLKVYKAGTLQTLTTHYTVSGAGNPAGGTVTFLSAPTTGQAVVIFRDPALTQNTDYVPNDPFPAESHERALDRLTMIAQRNRDLVGRAFVLPDGDASGASTTLPSPEADKVIAWNSTGTALQNRDATDFATALTYADRRVETFTGNGSTVDFVLAETPAVIANTDVDIEGVSQVPGVDYQLLADGVTIRFDVAPANGMTICVKYGQAVAQDFDSAAIVSYSPSGAGAVTTTVQAALRRTVSVKDFGAVGDGVANDTSAIQFALNYWIANRCDLVFPPGSYLVTSPLTAIASSNKVDGNRIVGYGATIQGNLPSSGILFKIGVSGALWRYFTIEGLSLRGATNETDLLLIDGGAGGSGEYVYGWELHRVNCEAFPGNGITITENAFEGTLFSCNSRTSNTTGYPIYINYGAGAVSSISLIDCTTSGGKKGVYAPSPVSDIRMWGGTYILAQEEGVRLDNALGGMVSNLHLERNWEGAASFAASGAGLAVSASQNFTISGCVGTTNNKQKYVVRAFAGTNASIQIIGGSNSGLITTYAQLEGTNSAASDVRGFTLIGNHSYDVVGTPSVMQIKGEKTVLGYTRKQVTNLTGTVTLTPDPRNGKSVYFIHQTGNATINAPSAYTPEDGDEMEFIFEQGGVGGYSVTFAADYMVNWTPNTTFGRRNVITFRWAGTTALGSGKQWVQVASSVGLV